MYIFTATIFYKDKKIKVNFAVTSPETIIDLVNKYINVELKGEGKLLHIEEVA